MKSLSSTAPVTYSHLVNAMGRRDAVVDPVTGRVYTCDDQEQPPFPGRCIDVPDATSLETNPKKVALAFTAAHMPEREQDVLQVFSRAGAMQRLYTLLGKVGLMDAWSTFEEEAKQQALREWCEQQGITLDVDI